MQKNELPEWLLNLRIFGREGDEGDEGNEGDEGEEGEEDGDNEDDDQKGKGGDDNSGDGDDDDDLAQKVKDLEATIAKERKLRRQAEREARKNKRTPSKTAETKTKAADTELQKQLEAASAQTRRLADGLRKKEVDDAILAAARKAGFIDETDALTDDIRKKVDVDQDPEDPTDIDIDEDSVTDAVKDLAARKKHLVGKATPGSPSGSKFRKRGNDDKPDKNALVEHYPSLG